MKAIVLAAGRGSRLMPFTNACPKCLTELNGRSLISRQIESLRNNRVDDIIILTGYHEEMLNLPGTRKIHNSDWANTNMVESLFCAEADFGDDFLVCYSDIVYSDQVLRAIMASTADISVIVDRKWRSLWERRFSDPLSDAESLRMNTSGHITDIGNKVTDINEIEAQYIGITRFRNNGITALREARHVWDHETRPWMKKRPVKKAYMTDLLTELILSGHTLQAVLIDGGWAEIDTPHDLIVAESLYAENLLD